MIKRINTKDIKASDLPPRNADWHEISLFALSWDPMAESKNSISPYSSHQPPNNDATILEIRAYIYNEQRWWNNKTKSIDEDSLRKLQQVIELLREKLKVK